MPKISRYNHFQPWKDGNYIAYIIEDKLTLKNAEYKKLIIIHNAKPEKLSLNLKNISDLKNAIILVDNIFAGIKNISNSEIFINNADVIIPAKCTTVIAAK